MKNLIGQKIAMLDPDGVDQRADIYGIGLLIYELVTDKPAYMAKNLDALYDKIKNIHA